MPPRDAIAQPKQLWADAAKASSLNSQASWQRVRRTDDDSKNGSGEKAAGGALRCWNLRMVEGTSAG